MTETIMQCCYTNAVQEIGGKISSGWQPVAVSDNIPADAYNGCISLQNANATIQSPMVDERGNVLNLYEISGDDAFVYVSRTQYGLVDRLGRPNMFSHAYIFPWKSGDVLEDPNTFLTIDKSNFVDNEEAAKAEKHELRRTAAFTLERAMAAAGLTPDTYLTLIQCVYSQFSEKKTAKPLFVNYDGSEEQMQAILYCMYYGLPHYVRKGLSIASAVSNTVDSKNIVFSEFASRHELYIVPQTGENNLLTARTERKIARLGFVDYAARNCTSVDARQYFAQLDKLAAELGDPAASNELVLKIAHQMSEGFKPGDLSEEELDSRVSDALRSKTYGSQRMDNYISDLLDEIRSRKMFLTEENEANLADRLAVPAADRLTDSGEQYNIYRFSTLSVEEAARMLTHMSADVFARYSQTLAKSEKGLQILDCYYAEYALKNREITWDSLAALADETSFMTNRQRTTDLIDAKAWELYFALVEKKGEAAGAYHALMTVMGKLYGPENQLQHELTAKEVYWERKRFADFAYEDLSEYETMSADAVKCSMFAYMYQTIDVLRRNGEDAFLKYLHAFFRRFSAQIEAEALTETILGALENEARVFCENMGSLSKWMKAVTAAEDDTLLEALLDIKEALRRQDYDEFVSVYLKLLDEKPYTRNFASLMRTVSTALCEECIRIDKESEMIPLDVWILIGASRYPNCFELFETLTPAPRVLQADETFTAIQSRLLGVRPYSAHAEAYAQRKGPEAKIVRKWLNERRAAEKRRRADERKAQADSDGWGLGHFFRGNAGSSGERTMNRGAADKSEWERASRTREIGFEEQESVWRRTEPEPKRAFGYNEEDDAPAAEENEYENAARRAAQRSAQEERNGFSQQMDPLRRYDNRRDGKQEEKKGFWKDLFGRK